ncbi:hypothetical protein ACFV1L_22155 [Kitasatospora sp. NPDC059646]|uniref:hypothetical protein n=1 Tax=Kitasatospora sp. NPDC059646 TaxID=3346893 RepID=UPI003673DD30
MGEKVWSLAYEAEGTEDAAWTIRDTELDDDGAPISDSGPWDTNAEIEDGDDDAALAWANKALGLSGDWKAHHPNPMTRTRSTTGPTRSSTQAEREGAARVDVHAGSTGG